MTQGGGCRHSRAASIKRIEVRYETKDAGSTLLLLHEIERNLKGGGKMKEETERTAFILGIECKVRSVKCGDGRWRDAYRCTVPGWEECEIIGFREAKRVVNGRLEPTARWVHGIEH